MNEDMTYGPVALDEVTVTADRINKRQSLSPEMNLPKTLPYVENPQQKFNKSIGKESMLNSNGFYYNKQLDNELISVSLHVNTETTDGGITWNEASGDKDGDGWGGGYQIKPIFRAILNEDYQTAISNSWSEFGGDAIGGFFNQFKPYAPYLGHLAKSFKRMNETEEQMKFEKNDDINTKFGKLMDTVTDVLGSLADEGTNILNRALIVQGARFSYYSGTGVGFGNLTMKFTVFADWDETTGEFKSVDSQLQPLYPYCFGKFVKFFDEKGNITNTDGDAIINKTINNLGADDAFKDEFNKYFGWQLPPGGFEADIKDIDLCQKGTLKLKFGAFYSLNNLVISDAQFNFSRQMVKNWDKDYSGDSGGSDVLVNGRNDLSPYSCDVILTFRPASKYTDNKLYEFVSGSNMKYERNTMENVLGANIMSKKEELNRYLGGN